MNEGITYLYPVAEDPNVLIFWDDQHNDPTFGTILNWSSSHLFFCLPQHALDNYKYVFVSDYIVYNENFLARIMKVCSFNLSDGHYLLMEFVCGLADEASSGSPRWIGKSLSCVCIKRKGVYERICMNLTPVQVRYIRTLQRFGNTFFLSG